MYEHLKLMKVKIKVDHKLNETIKERLNLMRNILHHKIEGEGKSRIEVETRKPHYISIGTSSC